MAYEKTLALFSQPHGQCLLCLIAVQDLHGIEQCSHPQRMAFEEQVRLFKKQIKFAPYSGCFKCGIPQQVYQRWDMVARGFHKRSEGEWSIVGYGTFTTRGGRSFGGKDKGEGSSSNDF